VKGEIRSPSGTGLSCGEYLESQDGLNHGDRMVPPAGIAICRKVRERNAGGTNRVHIKMRCGVWVHQGTPAAILVRGLAAEDQEHTSFSTRKAHSHHQGLEMQTNSSAGGITSVSWTQQGHEKKGGTALDPLGLIKVFISMRVGNVGGWGLAHP